MKNSLLPHKPFQKQSVQILLFKVVNALSFTYSGLFTDVLLTLNETNDYKLSVIGLKIRHNWLQTSLLFTSMTKDCDHCSSAVNLLLSE